MGERNGSKIRYNIAMAIVYIIGIILLIRLFDLQIVHGQEYREESNTRLTRETVLKAARGNILDSSGNHLVDTKMIYNLELYKTKIDNTTLNSTLLSIANTLETNNDSYIDDFPISINPYTYKGSTDFDKWKKSNNIDSTYDAEACFNYYKNKYKVSTDVITDARKIITFSLKQNPCF